MLVKNEIYFIFIFLTVSLILTKVTSIAKSNQDTLKINSSLILSVGLVYGGYSEQFFNGYTKTLGGSKTEFDNSPTIGATLKYQILDSWKVGINASYVHSKLLDSYTQNVYKTQLVGTRSIIQNLFIKTTNFVALLEIMPYNQQFRTYSGLGAGISLSDINWNEQITTTVQNDTRKSGSIIQEKSIYPVFKIYTGTELLFDKTRFNSLTAGLIIEIAYTYIYRKTGVYNSIAKQFENPPEYFYKDIFVYPSYITFSMALSFEFLTLIIR